MFRPACPTTRWPGGSRNTLTRAKTKELGSRRRPVEFRREELVVERVPVHASNAPTDTSFEGEEVYIPLVREEVVVAKDTVVKEEVRVGKKSTVEQQTVSETLRKEDIEIEGQNDWAAHDSYWRQNHTSSPLFEKVDATKITKAPTGQALKDTPATRDGDLKMSRATFEKITNGIADPPH